MLTVFYLFVICHIVFILYILFRELIHSAAVFNRTKGLIRRKKENSEILLSSIDSCLWAVDTELKLVAFNGHYQNHLTNLVKKAPEIGKLDLVLGLPPEFSKKILDGYQRAFEGEAVKILDRGFNEDGSPAQIAMIFTPIRNEEGKIKTISCCRKDLTEFISLKDKLVENKTKFANLAWQQSHLVRGPLCSAMGLINLAMEDREFELSEDVVSVIHAKLLETDKVIHAIIKSCNSEHY